MTRDQPKDAPKPAGPRPALSDSDGLEERIERLEKRLDETIASAEPHHVVVKTAIDDEPIDPLRRAVDRASDKRDPRK